MLIDWSDEYFIGIPRIDEQHKMFFEGVHRLHKVCVANEGEQVVLETLVFLENYVRGHFQDEVAFMREHEYPRVEEHRKLHAKFLERYLELIGEFKESGPSQGLAVRMGEMVQGWLVDHIAEADRAYAKHVMERANRQQ
ncbi:MAG: hemerythrin family protein [Candidatus Nealsonbacteria bacterium]|nr:hemerythrin family protein [Candidatus Nealsonbacteria bacterium]